MPHKFTYGEVSIVFQLVSTLQEIKGLVVPSLRCLSSCTLVELAIKSVLPSLDYVMIKLPMGLKAYLPKRQILSSLKNVLHVFYYEDYEAFNFIPKKSWTVVDVGAFIGLWSLKTSKLVSISGKVIALEPNPDNYAVCRVNLSLNGATNVCLLPYALSSKEGALTLYVPEQRINSSLCKEYVNAMGGPVQVMEVRGITLRKLINLLSLSVIDLMKVDIEGHELELIKSLDEDLAKRIKRFVIEVHKEVVDSNDLIKILERLGYDVYVYEEYLPIQSFIYAKRL